MKKLFNKITNSEYFQAAIFVAIIALIGGMVTDLALNKDLFGKPKDLTILFLWILYSICWSVTIGATILIATADEEKHTVWAEDEFGIVRDIDELKGKEWELIVWGVIFGLLAIPFILLCKKAELVSLKNVRIAITLTIFLCWLWLPIIFTLLYFDQPNPSGKSENRPHVEHKPFI